ncbi:MAG TPA: PilW family protein [Thermoanaerobaculia bacterium]|nr:PilW family protein [Thermoanaerobaculia bacterium]
MTISSLSRRPSRSATSGFTLIEMIVVTLLLSIAMLGLLAVFDASARINKNETDVADAQGSVRYGIYQMTRSIRMAGAGGLYVTQAVLNHNDANLLGIQPNGVSYDNVAGVTVTDTFGNVWNVRDGTDMIEVRGVLNSPIIGFDESTSCNPCTGTNQLNALPIIGGPQIGYHLNNDPTRTQFAAIDAYTQSANVGKPMLVIVQDAKNELHACGDLGPPIGLQRYPQPPFNVGVITAQTNLASGNTFGSIDFANAIGQRFNVELPSGASQPPATIQTLKRAGILDDVVYFITTDPATDPTGIHPFLAQGYRRGNVFEVSHLADDVEDMQVAYGIDTNGDSAVTRLTSAGCPINANDPDPNFSTTAGCDEWFPNAVGEVAPVDTQFQEQSPFNPSHSGLPLAIHCPRLHAVMISLLAKARDSDPTYKGPAANGYKIMNSTAAPITPGLYRRRVQTLKINLRNYAFQG